MYLRFLLFPFTIIYGIITTIRNKCFDWGWFYVKSFNIPIICVGNLSTGGTGKTPHVEYLIELLSSKYRIAVLSRGYKRTTKGFVLAKPNFETHEIGDEPMQYFKKYPNIIVAVDEKRVRGIENLLNIDNPPTLILLDDAYQHRSIKAKINILLTDANKPFYNDYLLPTGNLRECKAGYKRADIIIMTKISEDIDYNKEFQNITPSAHQKLYFTEVSYKNTIAINDKAKEFESIKNNTNILLVTGIANPKPIFEYYTKTNANVKLLKFADHHDFQNNDITTICNTFNRINGNNKVMITTEKDATRLLPFVNNQLKDIPIFVQPISIIFMHNHNKRFKDYFLELILR